jgi:hypothetical protein
MSKSRPDAGTFDVPIQRPIFGRGLSAFFKSKPWADLGPAHDKALKTFADMPSK